MDETEFEFMVSALQLKYGWMIGVASWQTLIRLVFVFINTQLKNWMEQALPEDKDYIQKLFNSRGYRITCFIVNAVLSIKLPTKAKVSTGQTEVFSKPPTT